MDTRNDVPNNIMDTMTLKTYENAFIIGNFRSPEEQFIMLPNMKYFIF